VRLARPRRLVSLAANPLTFPLALLPRYRTHDACPETTVAGRQVDVARRIRERDAMAIGEVDEALELGRVTR
jgi:hypothetical protein